MDKAGRQLAREFIAKRITREHFLKELGLSELGDKAPLRLIEECRDSQDADGLEYALAVGFRFGFSGDYVDVLSSLAGARWHHSHEDVVSAMDKLRDNRLVAILLEAARIVPDYLSYDDNRALAVKAIWALGNIGSAEAISGLRALSAADQAVIREAASHQLKRLGAV